MFQKSVKNQDGVRKTVVAGSKAELDEQVVAVRAEKAAVAPNILDPEDGNKVVSPDNRHTEAPFDRAVASS